MSGHVPALSFRELVRNWLDTESKLRIVAVRKDSQLQGLVFGAMVEGSAVAHNGLAEARWRSSTSRTDPRPRRSRSTSLGAKGSSRVTWQGRGGDGARLVVKKESRVHSESLVALVSRAAAWRLAASDGPLAHVHVSTRTL